MAAREDELKCELCPGKQFKSGESLEQHRLKRHNWCFGCWQPFESADALDRHVQHDCPYAVTDAEDDPSDRDEEERKKKSKRESGKKKKKSEKTFCDICDLQFDSESRLDRHFRKSQRHQERVRELEKRDRIRADRKYRKERDMDRGYGEISQITSQYSNEGPINDMRQRDYEERLYHMRMNRGSPNGSAPYDTSGISDFDPSSATHSGATSPIYQSRYAAAPPTLGVRSEEAYFAQYQPATANLDFQSSNLFGSGRPSANQGHSSERSSMILRPAVRVIDPREITTNPSSPMQSSPRSPAFPERPTYNAPVSPPQPHPQVMTPSLATDFPTPFPTSGLTPHAEVPRIYLPHEDDSGRLPPDSRHPRTDYFSSVDRHYHQRLPFFASPEPASRSEIEELQSRALIADAANRYPAIPTSASGAFLEPTAEVSGQTPLNDPTRPILDRDDTIKYPAQIQSPTTPLRLDFKSPEKVAKLDLPAGEATVRKTPIPSESVDNISNLLNSIQLQSNQESGMIPHPLQPSVIPQATERKTEKLNEAFTPTALDNEADNHLNVATGPTDSRSSRPTPIETVIPASPGPSGSAKYLGVTCPLCRRRVRLDDMSATVCGHIFCYSCIREAVGQEGAPCVVCGRELKGRGKSVVKLRPS